MRLFVLPFAGGGAGQFRPLRRAASDWLDVQPVQPPGREGRLIEAPIPDLPTMVAECREAILPLLDRPFALLGYSMGARLALGLAHALAAAGDPRPMRLIVAAHAAPGLPSRIPPVETLSSEAFWALIARYEGTPAEVLDYEELKALVEPALRADFRLARQDVPRVAGRLEMPVLALAGAADGYAAPGDMQPWERESDGAFRLEVIEGGHFFLRTHADAVAKTIFDTLEGDLRV